MKLPRFNFSFGKIFLLTALTSLTPRLLDAQCAISNVDVTIDDELIIGSSGSTTVRTSTSETGYLYALRTSSCQIVDAAYGTGGALSFETGVLTETTNFDVYAIDESYTSKGLELSEVDESYGDFSGYPWNEATTTNGLSFTIEFWVLYNKNLGANQAYVNPFTYTNGSTGFIEIRTDNGTIYYRDRNNSNIAITQQNAFSLDCKWHHVALVYDASQPSGSRNSIYVDGVSQALTQNNDLSSPYNASGSFQLGSQTSFYTLDGGIDELRFWSDARTEAEIQASMYGTLSGSETDLVAYYNFQEGSGTTVSDVTANSYDITLVNTTDDNWVTMLMPYCDRVMDDKPTVTFGEITDQSVSIDDEDITCSGSTIVRTASSQSTVNYGLREKGSTYCDDFLDLKEGNGSALALNTGVISEDTEFEIFSFTDESTGAYKFGKTSGSYASVTGYPLYDATTTNGLSFTLEFLYKHDPNATPALTDHYFASVNGASILRLVSHIPDLDFAAGTGLLRTRNQVDVNDCRWYHIAYVYDESQPSGSRNALYINGVKATPRAIPGNNADLSAPIENVGGFVIGSTDPTYTLSGAIDEYRIWSDARSEAEIQANMYSELVGNEANLISYYNFEEGTGSTLNDVTGNGYNVTIVNGSNDAWTTTSLITGELLLSENVGVTINPIVKQTVTSDIASGTCTASPTISLADSETGFDYYLRNNANDTILQGPVAGTDNAISFSADDIDEAKTYNVVATNKGLGLKFNGVDERINLSSGSAFIESAYERSQITLEAWIKTSDTRAGYKSIMVKELAYGLLLNGSGELVAYEWSGQNEISTGVAVNDGVWHHIALVLKKDVVDGSTIYIDGLPVKRYTHSEIDQNYDLILGSNHTNQWYEGEMDNVRTWSTVRTDEEILANYTEENINGTGVISSYNFESIANGQVADAAGFNHYGVVENMSSENRVIGYGCSDEMNNAVTVTISNITSQAIAIDETEAICNFSPLITLASSEADIDYYLRNDDNDEVIAGPVVGTGASISIQAPLVTTDITYNVLGVASGNGSNTIGALDFDGTNDEVIVPHSASLSVTNSFTVEAWVNTRSYAGYPGIVSKNDNSGFVMWLDPNGEVAARVGNTGLLFGYILPQNEWHHLAMTASDNGAGGTNVKLYVDGSLIGSRSCGIANTETADMTIGNWNNSNNWFWDGQLSEIRIWNSIRTDAEIADSYNGCVENNLPELKAYYTFSSGSGVTLVDQSSNGNNGSLTNMDASNDWVNATGLPYSCFTCYAEMANTVSFTVTEIVDQEVSTNIENTICTGDVVVSIASSQTGVQYYLRDNADNSVIDGPKAGTGSRIDFATVEISETKKYNVYATSSSCNLVMEDKPTVTIAPCAELVINEVDYDQPRTDNLEFIEIYNTGTESVSLNNMYLDLVDGTSGTVYRTITLPNTTLTAKEYYVICGTGSAVKNCDFKTGPNFDLIQNDAEAIELRYEGITLDVVSYEGSVADYTETQGLLTADDGNTSGLGISRIPNGVDTDNNNADFKVACATPGFANEDKVSLTVSTGENIDICEGQSFHLEAIEKGYNYNWSGPNGYSSSQRVPYIGMSNANHDGDFEVLVSDIYGCVGTATQNVNIRNKPVVTVGVSEAFCEGGDLELSASSIEATYSWSGPNGYTSNQRNSIIENADESASGVYTLTVTSNNCSASYTVDAVVEPGPDLAITYSGNTCTGKSFQMIGTGADSYNWTGPNGFDSNGDRKPIFTNADLSLSGTYTLRGETNFGCVAELTTEVTVFNCLMVINEVEYDSPGAPDENEFIELKNISEDPIDLGNFTIELINGSNKQVYDIINLPSQLLMPDDYFVICGNDGKVDNCDMSLGKVDFLQNGSPDAIRLLRSGILVDVLSYEGTVSTAYEGQGSSIRDDGTLNTIARIPDGFDSQNNQNDFQFVCKTPGRANEDISNLAVDVTSDKSLCAGEALTLVCSNSDVAISWTGPSGLSSSANTINIEEVSHIHAGTYTVNIVNDNGCRGTANVEVEVKAIPNESVSSNSPVCLNEDIELNATGEAEYLWTGPNGFDSPLKNPTIETAELLHVGTYSVKVTGDNGCFIIKEIDVVVNPLPEASATANNPVCENATIELSASGGVSYAWSHVNGFTSTQKSPQRANADNAKAGIYKVEVTDLKGCKDEAIVEVVLAPTVYGDTTATACESFTWYGVNHTTSGNYPHTFEADNGCDSVVTLHLTINNADAITVEKTVCNSLDFMGRVFNQSGTYTILTENQFGCDSVITLELTVLPNSYNTESVSSCYNYSSPSGKYVWNTTGTYRDTLQNSLGCDSVITFNVTILEATSAVINPAVCDSYASPAGNVYTQTGTYVDVLENKAGCDSIITINLTILNESGTEITATACDSYLSPSGNYTWTESGTYSDRVEGLNCEEDVTVHLTIIKGSSGEETVIECTSYDWFGKTYVTSGDYQHVLENSVGCDSTVTLYLTINNDVVTDTNVVTCVPFTWYGVTYHQSGIYKRQLEASNGCDSIVALRLIIQQTDYVEAHVTTCDSYEWRGRVLDVSGEYKEKVITSEGCEIVFKLYLTISELDTEVTLTGNQLSATTSFANYQWLDCDNGYAPIEGATIRKFTPTKTGNYAVEISKAGCVDTSVCTSVTITGLNNVFQENEITLFPNPTSGSLNIHFDGIQENISIEVRDVLGKQVMLVVLESQENVQFELNQPKGVYFVSVRAENGTEKIWRVVKQ